MGVGKLANRPRRASLARVITRCADVGMMLCIAGQPAFVSPPADTMVPHTIDPYATISAPHTDAPLPEGGLPHAPQPDPKPPATAADVLRDLGTGVASYYGRRFHGRLTANGERFDMNAMTAAHRTLPFGSMVRVTNPANGRSITVRINDRGPFIVGRSIDLSRGAAQRIGMIQRGHASVRMELLSD